ncbi:signal transducer and activator of transcription 5B-like [Tubulanus polymorphus]|uniref:signal transducer and activator of transcription 5B-like n=1 Tax=Tubulanus polymorphus TaxID=672921 RepID=UPI003DA571BE
MSQWAKAIQLCGAALHEVYSMQRFPIEVRHYGATWIEAQQWADIDEQNPVHEPFAVNLLEEMIGLLEKQAADIDQAGDFINKVKIQQAAVQFRNIHGNNPLGFVGLVKNCLAAELRLIQQAENATSQSPESSQQPENQRQLQQEFEFINKCSQETENDLRQLQHKQESFIIKYQQNEKVKALLSSGQLEKEKTAQLQKQQQAHELVLRQMAQEILQARLNLAEKHNTTLQALSQVQHKVLEEELISWKRRQQLAGNGAEFDNNLDSLQQWCETLAELIWKNRQQILNVAMLNTQLPMHMPTGRRDLMPYLQTTITGLLSTLVTSTFIIEKQPPQVLKKDSRFQATVRLLVGGKLNIHMNPPQVRATVISESQARQLLKNEKKPNTEKSGEILNNIGTMEYHQATGQLSVTFRNMQLKQIKRADRKGSEAVTEEKFSILFSSSFSFGQELVFQVWTLSLPVVVTVHGNQECNAMATVLWDNAFAETGRVPFVVPDKVPWPYLAEALNSKFKSLTGRGMSTQNVNYLAQKLFSAVLDDYSQYMVTWAQFNKDSLPGRNFTFWEWFYAVLKLTKEYLKGPWNDGSILGFVSKAEAQDLLLQRPYGTFLLRFSDSEVGGITIAWVADEQQKTVDTLSTGEPQVWNLSPYTAKDFSMRSLGDRIKDLQPLLYLFPDIHKEAAFGKYFSASDETKQKIKEGYVGSCLKDTIPDLMGGQTANPLNLEYPGTPQNLQNPQSPASSIQYDAASNNVMAALENDDMDFDSYLMNSAMDYGAEDIHQININNFLTSMDPKS